jgi:hypothetical protein
MARLVAMHTHAFALWQFHALAHVAGHEQVHERL